MFLLAFVGPERCREGRMRMQRHRSWMGAQGSRGGSGQLFFALADGLDGGGSVRARDRGGE